MSESGYSARGENEFRFKKFSVSHDKSTMKVGTDAVLLGAWADVGHAKNILDIGTGNGTIALMLAQRSIDAAEIDAVEIEEADAMQAVDNFVRSPWARKIRLHHLPIQEFFPHKKYDVIVSNPPFFNNSQSPPDEKRYYARHTIKLNHNELTTAAGRLLESGGRFSVVLPFNEGNQFIELAESKMLYCSRKFGFRTRSNKKIERWLLEFQRRQRVAETGEILLYKFDEGDLWDDTYVKLTRDFYIKL